MELLYASGARAAELCGIRLGDIDLSRKVVKVLGKGGKQRLVPLTTTSCRFLERYLFLAGVTRPVSPVHGFRHTVATHLLGDGMDVRYVQAMLGHEKMTTTQVYAKGTLSGLRKHYNKHHPREKRFRGAGA